MDQFCCECASTDNLTDIMGCEHRICIQCVQNTSGDISCKHCHGQAASSPQHRPLVHSSSAPAVVRSPMSQLDDEMSGLMAEIPQLRQTLQQLIGQHRRGRQGAGQTDVERTKEQVNRSAEMAVKNINHRTQKLIEQVDEAEMRRKLGVVSLADDTDDTKGSIQMVLLLATALAEDDSDDFATVALGDQLIKALTIVQANSLDLELDDDIRGLGLEFAERPQDASIGTLVRKQNCIGIATLDNGEFLLAVDQRTNGGVCLGRAKKDNSDEWDDVHWIVAFQPLDVVAPAILGSFSATKDSKEQNIFLAVGREVFSVNIDRLFNDSDPVSSSTSVRNYRLGFLNQEARITAIDWYPSSPNHVVIANDKTEQLHVVDLITTVVLKRITPKVSFPAANCLMSLKINNVMQIVVASETSKKAAMITEDGNVLFYFKKPSEVRAGQSPSACLPRRVFLATVVELVILRQSKIGVMWVDETKGNPPVFVLYDTDDGTWRRIFSLDKKIPSGVTYMPPDKLAFCYDSCKVRISGFND